MAAPTLTAAVTDAASGIGSAAARTLAGLNPASIGDFPGHARSAAALDRISEPREVAVVVCLCSPQASFSTGANIVMDVSYLGVQQLYEPRAPAHLTVPAVIPRTIQRCTSKEKISIGMTVRIPTAAAMFQSTGLSVVSSDEAPIGIVPRSCELMM